MMLLLTTTPLPPATPNMFMPVLLFVTVLLVMVPEDNALEKPEVMPFCELLTKLPSAKTPLAFRRNAALSVAVEVTSWILLLRIFAETLLESREIPQNNAEMSQLETVKRSLPTPLPARIPMFAP